jgi:hypothetical protein
MHHRLYRRMIEIRDGLLLRLHLSQHSVGSTRYVELKLT